jgi:hypothetical protein
LLSSDMVTPASPLAIPAEPSAHAAGQQYRDLKKGLS